MADPRTIVLESVAQVAKRDPATVNEAQRLAEDLSIRSLARIELAARLEDALGVTLSNTDVMKARTVLDLVKLVAAPV